MWISWSWPGTITNDDDQNRNCTNLSVAVTPFEGANNRFKDHPLLALFEKSNVLSRIEVTRLRAKRRLCFNQLGPDAVVAQPDLPQELWECNDLEKLYLAGNAIQQVYGDRRGRLCNGEDDEVNCVKWTCFQVPPGISNLDNLTVLSLSKNSLQSFPEEITHMVQLKWLNLSGNVIPEIPESIQRIRYLEVLWCNNSKVTKIHGGVGFCYHLNTLGLRGNLIQTIPENLSQLTNLSWLTLENNQIESLPPSMECLSSLTHLNVQNNCIKVLPNFFQKLRCLKYAFLNSNRIQSVHMIDLFHTNHLRVFDLNCNPFPDDHIIPVLKVGPRTQKVSP